MTPTRRPRRGVLATSLALACLGALGACGEEPWTDADGHEVKRNRVLSFAGAEHCDWQDVTFLFLDAGWSGEADTLCVFVRDPSGELDSMTTTTFSDDVDLPGDATDSGLRHGDDELWLVPDGSAAYLLDGGDRDDVERWPAETLPIRCA